MNNGQQHDWEAYYHDNCLCKSCVEQREAAEMKRRRPIELANESILLLRRALKDGIKPKLKRDIERFFKDFDIKPGEPQP